MRKKPRGPTQEAPAPFFKRRGCASRAGFAVARLCGHKGAQTSIWPKEGTEEEEEKDWGLGRAYPPCVHLRSTPEPFAQHICVQFSHNPLSGLKTTRISLFARLRKRGARAVLEHEATFSRERDVCACSSGPVLYVPHHVSPTVPRACNSRPGGFSLSAMSGKTCRCCTLSRTRARAGRDSRDVCQGKTFATGAPLARALALSHPRSLLPLRQTTGIDNRYGQQHCVTHWPKGHRPTPGELYSGELYSQESHWQTMSSCSGSTRPAAGGHGRILLLHSNLRTSIFASQSCTQCSHGMRSLRGQRRDDIRAIHTCVCTYFCV